MFGSEVVAEYVYQVAAVVPEVTSTVGSRIVNLPALPAGTGLPALIHYAEQGDYGGPVTTGFDITSEQVRYITRLICAGESSEPIRLAAHALLHALSGPYARAQVSYAGEPYTLSFLATGEWPLTAELDETGGAPVYFRQLGTIWRVDVMRG